MPRLTRAPTGSPSPSTSVASRPAPASRWAPTSQPRMVRSRCWPGQTSTMPRSVIWTRPHPSVSRGGDLRRYPAARADRAAAADRRPPLPGTGHALLCPEFSPDDARAWLEEEEPGLGELGRDSRHVDYIDLPTGHWPRLDQPRSARRRSPRRCRPDTGCPALSPSGATKPIRETGTTSSLLGPRSIEADKLLPQAAQRPAALVWRFASGALFSQRMARRRTQP